VPEQETTKVYKGYYSIPTAYYKQLKQAIGKISKEYQQDHQDYQAEIVRFKAWLLPSDHTPFKEAYCFLKIKPFHFFKGLDKAVVSHHK